MLNYLSCATELCATDRHGEFNHTKSILPNQSCQINLGEIVQLPGNLARLTNVGLHSSISTLVVHTHQVPLAKCEEKDSLSNEQHVLTILKYVCNTDPKRFVVLYSECHQGQHLHCLHSFMFISCVLFQPIFG